MALTAIEGLALIAAALAPISAPLPIIGLLVVASMILWARGRSWFPAPTPAAILVGSAAVGALALGLALALSPALGDLTDSIVVWSQYPIARGQLQGAIMAGLIAGATAVATELVFRGWVLARVRELAPRAGAIAAIVCAAAIEAAVTQGDAAVRAGAFAMGVGGGALYVGAGGRVTAPIVSRVVFELGSVMLTWLTLVR
jgi:hypothetical protein